MMTKLEELGSVTVLEEGEQDQPVVKQFSSYSVLLFHSELQAFYVHVQSPMLHLYKLIHCHKMSMGNI